MGDLVFQFSSVSEFLAMNGHGPYVWSAYGISALVLLWLVLVPIRRRRKLLAALASRSKYQAR